MLISVILKVRVIIATVTVLQMITVMLGKHLMRQAMTRRMSM